MAKIRDAHSGRMRNATDLDETRIRFNWGYHDGAADWFSGYPRPDHLNVYTIEDRHFDPVYGRGYVVGWRDAKAGEYANSSAQAWESNKCVATLAGKYAPFRKGICKPGTPSPTY